MIAGCGAAADATPAGACRARHLHLLDRDVTRGAVRDADAHRLRVADPDRLRDVAGPTPERLARPRIRTAVGHADGVGAGPVTALVLRLDGERRGRVPLPTDADQIGAAVDDLGPAGVDGVVRRGHRLAGDLRGRRGSRRARDLHRRQHHEGEAEERAEGRDDEERAAPHGRRRLSVVARRAGVAPSTAPRPGTRRPVGSRSVARPSGSPRRADAPERPTDRELRRRRAARTTNRRLVVIGIVVVALAGIAMRVWVLHTDAGVLDSDEGVPGLMARHFLDGHFSTFYWGQQYGGSLEVLLDAIAVFIGGSTRLALKAPPLLEALGVCAARVATRSADRGRVGGGARGMHGLGLAGELRLVLDEGAGVLPAHRPARARHPPARDATRRAATTVGRLARAGVPRRHRVVDRSADRLHGRARAPLARVARPGADLAGHRVRRGRGRGRCRPVDPSERHQRARVTRHRRARRPPGLPQPRRGHRPQGHPVRARAALQLHGVLAPTTRRSGRSTSSPSSRSSWRASVCGGRAACS